MLYVSKGHSRPVIPARGSGPGHSDTLTAQRKDVHHRIRHIPPSRPQPLLCAGGTIISHSGAMAEQCIEPR